MKIKLLILVAVTFVFFSCKKTHNCAPFKSEPLSSVTFGTFAGRCAGNCFVRWRLDNTQLTSDTAQQYFTYNAYNYVPRIVLAQTKYDSVKFLLQEVPFELLEVAEKTYGCPDCRDQGGCFIEVTKNDGTKYRSYIDTDDTSYPSEAVKIFQKQVQKVISMLR